MSRTTAMAVAATEHSAGLAKKERQGNIHFVQNIQPLNLDNNFCISVEIYVMKYLQSSI